MHHNSKTNMEQDVESNLAIVEQACERLDHAGHPADDTEICHELMISRDKRDHILNRVKWLDIGQFAKAAYLNGNTNDKPPMRYVPDTCDKDNLPIVVRQSEIQHPPAKAIEALSKKEQPVRSPCYRDESNIRDSEAVLRINRQPTSHLCTQRQCDVFDAKSGNRL
jgi:DNA-directed RNA polymerase specialized sigma subunit